MSSDELGERDAALLLDMLMAARDAKSFVAGMDENAFARSRLHQSAVVRALEVVGEAAGTVSMPCRERMGALAWRDMTAMRTRPIHGYADVRLDLVWDVVSHLLPGLIIELERSHGDSDRGP